MRARRKTLCRAGIALRAEAGTLCSAGRATFLGCAGGLLRLVRATLCWDVVPCWARNVAQPARNLRAQRRARMDAQPRFHDFFLNTIQYVYTHVFLDEESDLIVARR